MNLNTNDAVQISCVKIDHPLKGMSLVKLSVEEQNVITDHYIMTPSNRSYMNDAAFFNQILSPILTKFNSENKPCLLNFSQGFPVLEMLAYRADQLSAIKDRNIFAKINEVKDILTLPNISLGKQIPIRDMRKSYEENQTFANFREAESDFNLHEFNKILYSQTYQIPAVKTHHSNSLNIIQNVDDRNVKSYLITYQDRFKKMKSQQIYQFYSIEEERSFFKSLMADIEKKDSRTTVYSNDHEILKYRNKEAEHVVFKRTEPLHILMQLLKSKNIVDYYKNRKENLPSTSISLLNEQMRNEIKARKEKNINNIMGVKGLSFANEIKAELIENPDMKNAISHVIIKRLVDDQNENIFVSIVKNKKEEDQSITTEFYNFSVDVQSNSDDELIFSKFSQLFENKLGYPLINANSQKCQILLENFEERGVLAWKIKNDLRSDLVNFGWESYAPYTNMLNEYIKNNHKNTSQKNRLMAEEKPTDQDTICVYSDASLHPSKRTAITYGAVVRAPDSDKVIFEIGGVKSVEHYESTCIAEEIGIIESLKTIKSLMQRGDLDKNKNVEIRCDNIDVVEGFSGKDGVNEKVVELYASENYSKDEVNEILSYFKGLNFKWVRGHCNDIYNEKADKLAKKSWNLLDSKEYITYGNAKVFDKKLTHESFAKIPEKAPFNKNNDKKQKNPHERHKRRRP